MKGSSFNTVLNIILLIAVAVLFSMQFMNDGKDVEVEDQTQDTLTEILPEAVATIDASGKIVYVNTDSLLTNYKLSVEIKGKLKYKQEALEQEVETAKEKMQKEKRQYNLILWNKLKN